MTLIGPGKDRDPIGMIKLPGIIPSSFLFPLHLRFLKHRETQHRISCKVLSCHPQAPQPLPVCLYSESKSMG